MTPAEAMAAIRAGRKMLTLLAVMGVAGGLYVWGETARRDRDQLAVWGDLTCTAAGSEFRPAKVKKRQWGVACLAEVRRLGRIEGDLAKGSADALIAALDERMGKEAADAALAAVMSKRAADAAARMEAADAAVQEDDRVGAGWACAVNDLGGLRAPDC